MATPGIIVLPSLKSKVSDVEWQTRVDLAACYRLVDMVDMSDMINSHISARIPGTEEFLINPYGWLFDEVTASSLVKIDLEGNIVGRAVENLTINPAGYVVHSAVHAARPDVGASSIPTRARAARWRRSSVACCPSVKKPCAFMATLPIILTRAWSSIWKSVGAWPSTWARKKP